jgi:phage shock protein PspC (stress-responsive transcriptional regulator)
MRKITRSRDDRMIAGVCAGIAKYLKIDPTVVRLSAVVLAIFTLGTAVVAYAAGWLLMPEDSYENAAWV